MKKFFFMLLIGGLALPAFCDSINLMGGFVNPRGHSDIFTQNVRETNFRVSDLRGFNAVAGYDHFIGEYFNVGGSVTFYSDDTRVTDSEFERVNGDPVRRTISLQVIPLELNLHVLPIGRENVVIPYAGGGVGAYVWEYEERGDFILDRNTNHFRLVPGGRAFSDGTSGGWHVEGGVQIPFSRSMTATAEVKYWRAHGDLDQNSFDAGFQPIDLSATTFNGGVSIWF